MDKRPAPIPLDSPTTFGQRHGMTVLMGTAAGGLTAAAVSIRFHTPRVKPLISISNVRFTTAFPIYSRPERMH
jgi:hypothetical protein